MNGFREEEAIVPFIFKLNNMILSKAWSNLHSWHAQLQLLFSENLAHKALLLPIFIVKQVTKVAL